MSPPGKEEAAFPRQAVYLNYLNKQGGLRIPEGIINVIVNKPAKTDLRSPKSGIEWYVRKEQNFLELDGGFYGLKERGEGKR